MALKQQTQFNSLYKGVIVDTNDPLKRGRVRVHVHGIDSYEGTTNTWGTSGDYIGTITEETRWTALSRDIRQLVEFGDYVPSGAAALETDALTVGSDSPTPGSEGVSEFEHDFTAYPWAETASLGGKQGGMKPAYRVGDTVWVAFEGGISLYPIVIGGWNTGAFGQPDHDAEFANILADGLGSDPVEAYPELELGYETSRRRHSLLSFFGDHVEVSETPDEQWVRVRAGQASMTFSAIDDSVRTKIAGTMEIEAQNYTAITRGAFHSSEYEFVVSVLGGDRTFPDNRGLPLLGLYSMYETDVWAKEQLAMGQFLYRESWARLDPANGTAYDANGKASDPYNNEAWSSLRREYMIQTRLGWFAPRVAFIGIACPEHIAHYSLYTDRWGADPLPKELWKLTEVVRVEGTKYVMITANGRADEQKDGDAGMIGLRAMETGSQTPLTTDGIDVISCDMSMNGTSNPNSPAGADCQSSAEPTAGSVSELDGSLVFWADRRIILQAKDFRFCPGILEVTSGATTKRRNELEFSEGFTVTFPTPSGLDSRAVIGSKRLTITNVYDPDTETTGDYYVWVLKAEPVP